MDTTTRGARAGRPITAFELGLGFLCGLVALGLWMSVARPHRAGCEGVAGWTEGERAGTLWAPRGLPCRGTPRADRQAPGCAPEDAWEEDDVWDEPSDL